MLKMVTLSLTLLAAPYLLSAQGTVEMADAMRTDGKIYVVVGVMAIIFTGLFVYLLLIDRKVSRIEKGEKD